MTFVEMLKAMREGPELTQQRFAEQLGYSAQYLCDLERGRRMPSVELVNRICEWRGCGPKGRRDWHVAGARAHGWNV